MQRQFKRQDRHIASGPHSRENRLPQVELQILRGRTRHKRRPVASPAYLIGSAPDCDLVLGDPRFPEVYAYLLVDAEGVSLRHLGVSPELTLNGAAVDCRVRLVDGDLIGTGPFEFRIRICPPGRPAVPPALNAVSQIREGEAPAEPKTRDRSTAQQELRSPIQE